MQHQMTGDEVLNLSGALTFDTVAGVYLDTRAGTLSHISTVDLAGVTSVDSAGLALLLEWQSEARKTGRSLSFVNAPGDLHRLADLSESTGVLGLTARPQQER